MDVISLLLKARMDVKDDEMPKLDKIETDMAEQFKSITGVKVQNYNQGGVQYSKIAEIKGPLVIVDGVDNAAFDEPCRN